MILRDKYRYPPDNTTDFEYYAIHNVKSKERKPLPVTWTAYYKFANYGRNKRRMQDLQNMLNRLKGKYYTVCQWDDGIMHDISHLDCVVFSMGKKQGYPLPLISMPHKYPQMDKDIFCSFVGKNTHPIRSEVLTMSGDGYYISSANHNLQQYCSVLARSVFSLCPRGYGATSFRIAESMQYGAIPVYISDVFIEPHNINFDEYGIKINKKDLNNVNNILSLYSDSEIKQKQEAVRYYYENYYTYDANVRLIEKHLNNQ